MEEVRSKDGTAIAFERLSDGQPVIVVGGATCDRAMARPAHAVEFFELLGAGVHCRAVPRRPHAGDRVSRDAERGHGRSNSNH